MKTLHISDVTLGFSFPNLNDSSESITNKLISKELGHIDLFIINVNFKEGKNTRADNAGILILKYLRLNHFKQHCVLYSFLSREQLMEQDPCNSIIFSVGVTFLRLPADLSKIDYESLIKKQAPDDLSNFFKAEFRLPDNRHFFANWWGILRLWEVQKAVEKIAGKNKISDVEKDLHGAIKGIHSYNGLVARYVRGLSDNDIERTLLSMIAIKKEKFNNEIRNRNQLRYDIENLNNEDSVFEIQLNTLEEIRKESKDNFFNRVLLYFKLLPSAVQGKINHLNKERSLIKSEISYTQDYLELIEAIEREKDHIYDERRKLNRQIQSKIDNIISQSSFLTEEYSLETTRKKLAEKKPAILFVDDQANEGWAAIFQRMIYGEESNHFSVIQPDQNESIESIVGKIETTIKEKNINLLMLDLRLKGEIGSTVNSGEISGIQVLDQLRMSQLPCPVLITSASNKIWSFRETLKLNADAYWIKEGLDDNYGNDDSVENYLRFIDLVYTLCLNEEYRFLYDKLYPAISKVRNSRTPYWWETKFWKQDVLFSKKNEAKIRFNKTSPVDKAEVIEILNAGFDLIRKFLSAKIQNYETLFINKYIGSIIIIQFSRILEVIHRFDENNDRISLSEKMLAQIDEQVYNNFSKLLMIRNSATHNFSVNFSTITNFIELFFDYLSSNILDIPNDELVKHENTFSEPVNDAWYISEIESKDINYPRYFLRNPNLILKNSRTNILLDLRFNRELKADELNLLDKIRFQLNISENDKGIINYFAKNAQKVNY